MNKVERLPEWIKVKVHTGNNRTFVNQELKSRKLATVCEQAKCPNLGKCWHQKTATFMLMGENCTRACRFCAIGYEKPLPLDENEPKNVAEAAFNMQLEYVVITSVARDDLADEGASHFAKTILEVNKLLPQAKTEILTPDFNGKRDLLEICLSAKPTVFNHNLETCKRLSPAIRGRAKYERSLNVLKNAKEINPKKMLTKSGIMVGLGETDEEVLQCINDLAENNVDILTIGQYLAPSRKHASVKRYVQPDKFKEWKQYALNQGFKAVASSPMTRSSYQAGKLIEELNL